MTLDIAAIVRAELAKFLKTGDAPAQAPAAVPAAVKKRTLSPEHLAKMQAGRKKKAAAKPSKPAKPAKAVKAAGVTVKTGAPAWTCEDYTTAKGIDGKIVRVGVFSVFVPKGDKDKAQAVLDTVNVIRGDKDAVLLALRSIGCNV